MNRDREGSKRLGGAVYALTGGHGSGKTSVCTQVVADARARGLDVAGIITGRSGPEPDAPREVVDIRSGDSRLFGTQVAKTARGEARTMDATSDPLTPRWQYGADVFTWANEILSSATPCELLVVDEVGPLELVGERGWVKALEVLRRGDFTAALVVCRPSLLDELEAAVGRPLSGFFESDLQKSVELPSRIVKAMFD